MHSKARSSQFRRRKVSEGEKQVTPQQDLIVLNCEWQKKQLTVPATQSAFTLKKLA